MPAPRGDFGRGSQTCSGVTGRPQTAFAHHAKPSFFPPMRSVMPPGLQFPFGLTPSVFLLFSFFFFCGEESFLVTRRWRDILLVLGAWSKGNRLKGYMEE